jgi:hypothetical protein
MSKMAWEYDCNHGNEPLKFQSLVVIIFVTSKLLYAK